MGFLKSLYRAAISVFDRFRKVMHFVMMLIFFMFILIGFSGGPKVNLEGGTALLLNPQGPLVDQLAGDPVSRSLDRLTGNDIEQTLTRDVVRAIEAAKEDRRVSVLVLQLGGMAGAGLTNLQLVGAALEDFKTSGKKVVSYSDFYSQGQYLLAAHADEVYMHPSGLLFIDGFGRFRRFYKDAIEKLSIDWNVFKVGEFKSFVEPYIRNDMSAEDRSSSLVWMEQLWDSYQSEVTQARGLESDVVSRYVENFTASVVQADGKLAVPAIELGLVDELWQRDQFRQRVLELSSVNDDGDSFRHIALSDYVAMLDAQPEVGNANKVGVIVASGNILDGDQPPGTIGGDSLARLIRKATNDENLDALVLYVDSGGGSKFASEIAQRELQLFKQTNRPFVAVMSSVAASGGYWLAMEGDEIWASPSTITGSIGIGGFVPTFQRTMARAGISVDGVGTTRLSGAARFDRSLSEDVKTIMQKSMEAGYADFIGSVAKARNMSIEDVDKIARGRVWSGQDAQRLGLVDRMGTLADGVNSAAERAGISGDFETVYLERELSFQERLTMMFSARMQAFGGQVKMRSTRPSMVNVLRGIGLRDLEDEIIALTQFNDPNNIYIHCFCELD